MRARIGLAILCVASPALAQSIVQEQPRLETSLQRLFVRWTAPTPGSDKPLSMAEAIAELRGKDRRPLLVLRDQETAEVGVFQPHQREHETTLLLTHWFHCVKIGRRAVEPGHPWHVLFAERQPPLLLLIGNDGQLVDKLRDIGKPRELHARMAKVLRADYRKDPMAAVKEWTSILDEFDAADRVEQDTTPRYAEAKEKGDQRREQRYGAKLQQAAVRRQKAKKREQSMFDLGLLRAPEAKTQADFDAEAAAELGPGRSSLLDKVKPKDQKEGK